MFVAAFCIIAIVVSTNAAPTVPLEGTTAAPATIQGAETASDLSQGTTSCCIWNEQRARKNEPGKTNR
jgi:hypothetical protein